MKKHPGKLAVQYREVGKLKPYAKNARTHPPAQIDKIKASLERFGWTNPILVDGKNGIVAGHGRLQAALQLGQTRVPVIELTGLSGAEKRAYLLADNRIATEAGWDADLLAAEFGDLKRMGVDLELTGFDPGEIEELLAPPPSEASEPPIARLQKTAVTKPGDLWLLGEHRLLCGDATKAASLKTLMAGAQAQCVFTDPPYGVSYEARSGQFEIIQGDNLRRGQLASMLHGAFAAAIGHTREDAAWYVWHASATQDDFRKALRDVGLVELGMIIWAKPGIVLGWADYSWAHEPCFYAARQGVRPAFHGARGQGTVWRIDARGPKGEPHTAVGAGVVLAMKDGAELFVAATAPKSRKIRHVHVETGALLSASGGEADDLWEVSRDTGDPNHPNQKPIELALRALRNSTQEGEGVLDFFAGGASTLMACEQLKRVGYALELDPLYVDAGVRRWQEHTGKQATHATEKKTFDAIATARTGRAKERTGKAKVPANA